MLEEKETSEMYADPPVKTHRPSSEKSQDISHVLASVFTDLYTKDIIGKDTVSNLIKTKNGRSSYHARYVEELQQAHSEYSQEVKEADMLERHIIQARARAEATESQAYERMKEEMGEAYDQSLLTVQSAFSWCVDSNLLEMNNLISPRDYLPQQKAPVKPPAAIKSNPAKPTIAYTMRVSKEPRDDGYTHIPEKTVQEMSESDLSLTFESSSDTSKRKKTPKEKLKQTKSRPKWKDEPSAQDRAEGCRKLQKLKERQGFLKNPRFLPPNAHSTQQGGTSLIRAKPKARKGKEEQSSTDDPLTVFLAKPAVLVFSDYSVGNVYETTLELKNLTAASRCIRVIPPTTPYFSIGLGRFPGESGIVAPGMSCKYTVRFAPDSLGDYEDFIVVESEFEPLLLVPIVGKRPPPVLTLPRVLDCGCCLNGGVKFVDFRCQNVGLSAGTFCIIPKSQWPASNLRSLARTYFSEQPPFAVSPSLFVLQPGESIVLEVVFFPTTAEKSCQVFTVVCDNCQVKDISIEGEGQHIALDLVSVSGRKEPPVVGEAHDLTAEHLVRFSSCNPHSVQQKKLLIRNNVHLELPFHWQIMKPNLHPQLPGETPEPSHIQFHLATDDAFHVSPLTGALPPCQEQEFLFTFCPKELKDYHSVCHLVLKDVPQVPPEPSDNNVLQPVHTGSKVSDIIVMEIEVKGSTEPYQVLLEPYAVVIPGEIFICTTTRRQFKMWNHSKTRIFFQWERLSSSSSHIMEVEPSSGRIEENECFDFDLVVIGGKPERVATRLLCHIEHHHEPISLAVEVSFKGPIVTLSVPSVDFGLVKLGEQRQTSLVLTNVTQLEASWALKENQDHQDPQILVEPCRGVLAPSASYNVDVLFMPRFCQRYETELELTVEDGTGCHLSVWADVQSPRVRLLNCELLFSELFIGVPAKGTVTLFNQTLLPSHFSWMDQLQGKHAELCRASFEPTSGTLGPNASIEITVSFTSNTDLELTKVSALCKVQEMNSPLVLTILISESKNLSVSYSLPNVCSESPSALLLDFGDDVTLKRGITKQFLITNQTAIPAPFTIEAEYFTCHASKPKDQSEKRYTYVKRLLHSVQAKKVEEKAHEEFMSSLLAHGKGAAFFISPYSGMLGPFETLTVDITAYADMWGEYIDQLICQVGELEAMLIPMQMTVKGCPLYFQMTGPRPDSQNQGPNIRFGAHVSGGDTVSRSLRINNPTMFDIRLDWETYNIDPNDGKLVDFVVSYGGALPLKDADGNELLSEALRIPDGSVPTHCDRNSTPASEKTSTSLQSMSDGNRDENMPEDVCEEEETCLHPYPAKEKLISVHIRPHMGNRSDYPYCITPQQIVIPAKGRGTIHVSFTPLTLSGSVSGSKCVGLAQGFMSLDSETAACVPGKVRRAQCLDLEPVKMNLLAVVKPAILSVQMEEDECVLEFCASAGDLVKGESELTVRDFDVTKTLQLKNNSEMPLHFRLGSQPPFFVVKPQARARTSNSSTLPTDDSQFLVLQPQHSMQVKLAFRCTLSLLDHADQAEEELPLGVAVIHSESGQRRLRFNRDLVIHHSNNSQQTVPLCAHLDLATVHLSTDSLNFGICYVGQTQTREVTLYSRGTNAYWKSIIDSNGYMFRVTPDFGCLRSKRLHATSCSQCLQISFTPSGDKEFRATVVIRSPLVKAPLTLQLHGTGSTDEAHSSTDDPVTVFLAKPAVLVFSGYSVGNVYETTLELKNLTAASRCVRVIPPTTPYFSTGLGRFPGESGIVAPGMSCKYTVRFAPDSLGDYEDFIVVESEFEPLLLVPIVGKRHPPVLTIPRVLDCGCCLNGGVKFVDFQCQNVGLSAGTFCIIPKNQWPASNLRSVARKVSEPLFAVSPSFFVLQPGESTVLEVVFSPTNAEKSCQVFTVVCDNLQMKDISIEGEGQQIDLELVSVSGRKEPPVVGEAHDLTAEHLVRFSSSNPHSVQQKKLLIRNNVHLELPFHWQIMKPNLHPQLPGETPEPSHIQFHLATDDAFHVSPLTGALPPCQEQEFLFTFCPKELKDYHSVCHLVLKDVPQVPPEPSDNNVLQPGHTGSKVSDVIVMELEVKGSTEPYQVLLEPYAVVIPGEIFICTTTRRQFKMWNHSKTRIFFQWERMSSSSSHIMEVEPSSGRIEENECFDFDLVVIGGKPDRVATRLLCHIEHHHEPISLAVEVSFKGPIVTLSVPSVDFGLVKLGEQRQTSLVLTNVTQLEASWALKENQDHQDPQILVEPCRGVLAPSASYNVDVLFMPRFCQRYETELELTVEDGTGCHLSVWADVQSPRVCLLNCELLFSELFIGVPAKGTVTLFNQTLLPSHFSWTDQLQGKHAELYTASFEPNSGTLGPNASMEITVSVTSNTDLELTKVTALCKVQEMNSPLVLSFVISKSKKLSVSYSLPNVCSESPSALLLDFGDDVTLKRGITKQFLITNQTAIPAPFTIEAEYFTCHASKPKDQSEKRYTYVKRLLHSVQAKKVEEKAHEEFMSSLLAHGKGAAFFISPYSGMLGPFETLTVDITAYADMWGEYIDQLICKVGELEAMLIPMQMTVKGCPLYFQMTGPRPDSQNQGPNIRFGAHVSGGDTVSRSLRINNPTMFDIRLDWETYNINPNDGKLVDFVVSYGGAFPLKDADGNELLSGALRIPDGSVPTHCDRNSTPASEKTSTSLQSMSDGNRDENMPEDVCEEEETCFHPYPAKEKLISVHIRPHMGNRSDYPYCITPEQIVIPAKGKGTIHVSFTPLTLSGSVSGSKCVGLAQGFMSLDSEMAACVPGKVRRAQCLDLEPVKMNLLAVVKPAILSVQMEEDECVLEFCASAGDLVKGESEKLTVRDFDVTQTLQLKNNSEMPLHFRLGSQPPFFVVKPQPRARTSNSSTLPTGDSQFLVLQPQHSMQVKLAFRCTLSLLDHADQAEEELPLGVAVIHSESGQRRLRFKQGLLIHHSNNSQQTVPLCAHLDLATVHLSTDSLNFGICYVGQTQTRELMLYSCGTNAYWKSIIDSNGYMFRVTPDFGCLRSKELHATSCSQCLQISFTPSGDKEFRATVVIRSPLVKTPLTLQLQGTGSTDEAHRKPTSRLAV